MQNDAAKIKNSGPMHAEHENCERCKSPGCTCPEELSERAAPGQTVAADWPAFDSRHEQSWYADDKHKASDFDNQIDSHPADSQLWQVIDHGADEQVHCCYHRQV